MAENNTKNEYKDYITAWRNAKKKKRVVIAKRDSGRIEYLENLVARLREDNERLKYLLALKRKAAEQEGE